jgi:hypothetical protein
MITDYQEGCVSGEPLTDDDVINYLFTLDFTEEELLELGFSEDAIDSANEANMSNGYSTFKITIEESISQTFEIEAESMEAAEEKAREKYKAGKLVLEDANLVCTQMMAETMDGSFSTSWNEI